MGVRHDFVARMMQLSRPAYGDELRFEGSELAAPDPTTVPTRHGPVPVLLYRGAPQLATYVHFHGGALMMRQPMMDDFWARFVVATTGLNVALVDYSVAPQVRYPVAHEQAYDVTRRLAERSPAVVVGGFSAGGNLAASVCLQAAATEDFAPRAQLLGVPSLDVAESVEDKFERVSGSMITPTLLKLVRATYFKDAYRRAEPLASPLLAKDLSELPRTMLVTAGRDVLAPEGVAYAARLKQDGVPVEHIHVPGVDHYFLHGAGLGQARSLMNRMAAFLAEV